MRTAIEAGAEPKLLQAVEAVNDRQKDVLFKKFSDFFGSKVSGMTVALWGLAFKPSTDDTRETPSRRFLDPAWASGVRTRAYDPVSMREAEQRYPKPCTSGELEFCSSPMEAIEGVEALFMMTEWPKCRILNFEILNTRPKQPVMWDGCNLYDPDRLKTSGFRYFAIGRGEALT